MLCGARLGLVRPSPVTVLDQAESVRRGEGDSLMSKLAIHGGEPVRKQPFPNREPFGEEEERLVVAALRTQSLYMGSFVERFEREFAGFYGAKHAVSSTSGSAALHVAIGAIDPDPGDEIITAPITDVGTITAIMLQTAIPVFADIDPATFNMDPADVERKITSRTRAIVVVHLFGNSADIAAMADVAKRHGVTLIEDCSQSHAIKLNGRYIGTYGDIGCFSLQQSKFMTTGDGGMTITENDAYAERMRLFMNKAVVSTEVGHREYDFLAPTYRMNELTAAVGLAQIPKLRGVVLRRQELGELLTSLISGIPGLEPVAVTPGSEHGYWTYPLRTPGFNALEFARALIAEGVASTQAYIGRPIYLCSQALREKNYFGDSHFPFTSEFTDHEFNYAEGACPVTEEMMGRMVGVSLNEAYSEDDIRDMAAAIAKVAEGLSA